MEEARRDRTAQAALGLGKQDSEEPFRLKRMPRVRSNGDRIAANMLIERVEAEVTAEANGNPDGVMRMEVGAPTGFSPRGGTNNPEGRP